MPTHLETVSAIRAGGPLLVLAPLLLGALAAPLPVRAHTGPEVLRLRWRDDSDGMVMVTNRGLLFGDTAERKFRLMCMEALGLSESERPDLALLPDGSVMLATSAGVGITRDEGCTWQAVTPFGNAMSPALAQDPKRPETLYLATFATSDGGGVHVSRDAGESWSRLLATEDDDFVQELRVAPSDPIRIYAAGQVFAQGEPTIHYIARSNDDGESWERFELMAAETEVDVALLAVNPSDPDVLLAATTSQDPLITPERLLISRDGGESFRTAFETQLIHDASFGSDGKTIWVAGSMGLWQSDEDARRFEKLQGPLYTSCVDVHEGTLWSCGLFAPEQDGVGTRVDGASGFETAMLFTDVEGPVACEPDSAITTRCAPAWERWESEVIDPATAGPGGGNGQQRPDAGSPESGAAGAEAGASAAGSARESDGCSALGEAGTGSLAQSAAWLGVALLGSRRRARRLERDRLLSTRPAPTP